MANTKFPCIRRKRRTPNDISKNQFMRMLKGTIMILILCLSESTASTCSSSVPVSGGISTSLCSFTSFTTTFTSRAVAGQVSNSIYYMHSIITGSYNVAVRRVSASNSQIWQASFAFNPISKSLSVDATESSAYIASLSSPVTVVRMSTSTGSIVSQQTLTGIGTSFDVKTWPLNDDSGYYIIGYDATNIAKLCKYTFSTSSAQCQSVTNLSKGYGSLMITSTQLFLLGVNSASPYDLHMFKVTFGTTSVNWANKLVCASGTCTSNTSESLLSADGLTLYSFFMFGSSNYMYLAGMSVSTGSVIGTRYKSSGTVAYIFGSGINGDYLIATTYSPLSLLIYSISTGVFTIKSYSGTELDSCTVEPSTGRFIVNGNKSGSGYTAFFAPQSISSISDFTAGAWSMTALASGTDSIVTDSIQTIGAAATLAITAGSYVNQSVTYVQGTTTTSDIYYQTLSQSITIIESNSASFTPDLSCSYSGSTSIVFSISSYSGAIIPSWVSINSTQGTLSFTAPSVSSNTDFYFNLDSTIAGVTSPVQKIMKITVMDCLVQNCQTCSSLSVSICAVCATGYTLSSGVCNYVVSNYTTNQSQASTEAKGLETSGGCITAGTIGLVILSNLTNSASMASIWTMINQMQMIFFLLLFRVFIPLDVKAVIQGPKFAFNIYSYIPITKIKIIDSIFSKFDFTLTYPSLGDIGINSDSSVYNIYPMFICILFITCLYIFLFVLIKCKLTEVQEDNRSIVKILKITINKLYNFMTFGFYIRNSLEMSQFILICTIYEIFEFNTSNSLNIISLAFAICIMLFYFSLMGFIIYLICSLYTVDEKSHNKLKEFFVGLKPSKMSRLYVVAILIRRMLYVTIFATLATLSANTTIGSISIAVIQILFIIYILILRPFEEKKVNIICFLNEFYFFVLTFCLIFLTQEDDWSSIKISAYMWIIASNSIVIFLIVIADGIRSFAQWIRARKTAPVNTEIGNNVMDWRAGKSTTIQPAPVVVMLNDRFTNKTNKPRKDIDNRKFDDSLKNGKDGNGRQIREESKYSVSDILSEIKIFKIEKSWN